MRALLLVCSAALLACGGTIEATRYDQSCTQDSDCVAVYSGALCGPCESCANAAINVSAKATYDADVKAITCPARGPVACAAAACLAPIAVCRGNTCSLAQ